MLSNLKLKKHRSVYRAIHFLLNVELREKKEDLTENLLNFAPMQNLTKTNSLRVRKVDIMNLTAKKKN